MPVITGTSPSGSITRDQAFRQALTHNAFWMIRLRWGIGSAVIVGSLVGNLVGIVPDPLELLIVGAVILGYNVVIRIAAGRVKAGELGASQTFWLVQVVADLLALSAVAYFSGGIESPVIVFYVFHMVCAGVLLSPRRCYAIATLATVLLGATAVLQAAVPSLHHPLAFWFAGHYFRQWPFVGMSVCAFAMALYGSVYLTTTIARRLRATEEQIVRHRDVLDSIISSMSEVLVFLSPDGAPLLWNSAGAKWLLSGDPTDAVMPEGLAKYVERVRQADAPLPAETFWVELPAGPNEPPRQSRACAAAVLDDDGRHLGYVIVAEDLTEQLQLEQDLRRQNREIRSMSEALRKHQEEMTEHAKMVAVGTMAAGVAHEVGNPLACLSAIVQVLQRQTHSGEESEHLKALDEQVGRITKILRELLDFARPDTNEPVLVDLDELTEQTVKMAGYSRRSQHARIESIPHGSLPRVRISPDQVQQVLINVILNALDAVRGADGEPVITIERGVENDWVFARVIDRGVGMTRQQIQQAFEPFYTTKPPGEGTGLGLAVSYRLVEQQGGRIRIDSSPGRETVVTVSFPAAEAQPPVLGAPGAGETSSAR